VVAFIQFEANKEVQQAGISQPIPVPLDAAVSGMSSGQFYTCNNSITPSATIKNVGADPITSLDINYRINSLAVSTFNWTGNLNSGQTATVNLPAINVPHGTNTLTISSALPNGQADLNSGNNQRSRTFFTALNYTEPPLTQGFQSSSLPADYAIWNPDLGATWTRFATAGGMGSSSASFRMDFFNSPPGQVDEFFLPPMNLTNITAPAELSFNMAHAQYAAENDKLEIMVSENCGSTWTTLFSKQGDELKTAEPKTTAYAPTASEWRTEQVFLDGLAGKSNVIIKFVATSAFGNNLFIDDISVHSALSVKNYDLKNNIKIYPNPATDQFTIEYSTTKNNKVSIQVHDAIGKKVEDIKFEKVVAGNHSQIINTKNYNAGIYFVTIISGAEVTTQKISVLK
jgi:hypothetical protein